MISLDIGHLGSSLRLTFAEISYDRSGVPRPELKQWHGQYREVDEMVTM
jgi:hypothetical protein